MKISIYIRDNHMWVETVELTNPDGCTFIDDDYNAKIRAEALCKLINDVKALSQEDLDALVVEVKNI